MSKDTEKTLAGIRIHPLWIAPEWVAELAPPTGLDPRQWVERSARAGVSGFILVTKQAEGRCIWPTAAPALRTPTDFLGEICDAAGELGVKILAYYCVAIDDYQAALHPEWRYVDQSGQGCRDIGYDWVCLNSPYRRLMLEQLEEILRGYPVDGLWLDIFNLSPAGRDCCCQWCRAKYSEAVGGDIVSDLGTPRFAAWRAGCLDELLGQVVALRDRFRENALITFNGAGAGLRKHPYIGPEGLPLLRHVDYLTDEGHDSRYESAMSKLLRVHGLPFEILTSNGIANEWVGWVTKPPSLLRLEAAVAGSHGGRFGSGVSVLPNGEMPEGELEQVSATAEFERGRAPLFVPQEGWSDVKILVQPFLPSGEFVPPERPDLPPRLPRPGHHHLAELVDDLLPCNGLWDAMREHHFAVDFVHEDGDFGVAPLLVLQSNSRLSDQACSRIRDYVSSGGCLLAEGHASLLDQGGRRRADFALADVLGISFGGYSGAWEGNYLELETDELREDLPSYPIHVIGQALLVQLRGARQWASLLAPLGGEQSVDHHTASLFNPPTRDPVSPAVTYHRFGRGQVVYFASSIGDHIRRRRNVDPWTKRLVANVVTKLVPTPLFTTDAPSGVELVFNRLDGRRSVLHLLNHYGADPAVSVEAGPRLAEIAVTFNPARLGQITAVTAEPSGGRLQLSQSPDGGITCSVPPFNIHQALVVESSPPPGGPVVPAAGHDLRGEH